MSFGSKQSEALAPRVCGPEHPFNPEAHSWWEIQEKVFTRWCNTHLSKRDLELTMGSMLRGGLDSGMLLWELLAELSQKEEEMPRYNRKARMRIHQVNNLLISLQFIEREKIKLVNIGAEDILDRQVKLILGLIWTLILRYQIQKGNQDSHSSAKNELLKWLNSIGIMVKDLTYDWSDGKQICHLVNKIQDLIPENEIGDNPIENAQRAIDLAYDNFEIPKVIDASDMASDAPDELVNMTYLSYFRDKWDELKAMAGGELLGPNPRTVQAKKPVTFSLSTYNVLAGNQISIVVNDKLTGKPVAIASHTPFKFNSPQKNVWDVTFTPLQEGNLSLAININGKPVKNAPLVLFVTPASFAKVLPGDRKATATKPFKFQLQTGHIKPSDLDIVVKDDKGRVLPNKITDTGSGVYEVEFTPLDKGKATAVVKLEGEECPGSPLEITVDPAPWAKLRKPEGKPTATKETNLVLDVVNVTPDDLKVTIKEPNGQNTILPRLKDNKDGTYSLAWVPKEKGNHTIEVTLEGKQVEGSPLTINVDPAPWAKLHRPEQPPTASKPCKMLLEAVNVDPKDLKATVKDANGNPVYTPKITKNGSNFDLEFTPTKEGKHTVEVLLEGKHVEGSPMTFAIDPKPWAKLNKPKDRVVASKPVKMIVDYINVKPTDLDAKVTDGAGKVTKPTVRDIGNGQYELEFTPLGEGKHTVDVKLEGAPVEGSPMVLEIEPKPWARLNRPSAAPVASKPFTLTLDVINVKPSDLDAKVIDAAGKPLPAPTVTDNKNGTFNLTFTPQDQGKLVVEVKLEGQHVENSPLILTSDPKPWAKLRKPEKAPVAGKPFKMFLDTVNVKPSDLDAIISDPSGKKLKPTIKDLGNGTFELDFTPEKEGKMRIDVNLEGKPVEGSPMTLDVEPHPWAKLTRPKENPVAAHPYTLKLETINVKPDDLKIQIADDKGKPLAAPKLTQLPNGTFNIEFTPDHKGPIVVSVDLEGKPVEGSPMKLDVDPCPWARVIGPSNRDATATKPFSFGVETINVRPNDLVTTVKDANTGKILFAPGAKEVTIKDNKDDTFTIGFVPPLHGNLIVEVLLEGKPIDGSPLHIAVAHKPTASIVPKDMNAIATKPFKFSMDTVNVNPADLDIAIADKMGNKLPFKLTPGEGGRLDVELTPLEPGKLDVNIKLDGLPIDGAPFTINVAPKPTAVYNGPKPVHATAQKPCTITLDTVNLKPNELDVVLRDLDGNKIPFQLKPQSPDKLDLIFTPEKQGKLIADLKLDGEPIDGAPIPIEVAPAPFARLVKPDAPPYVGRPFKLRLETINVKPNDLDINLTDDNGKKLPFNLRDNGDGTYDIRFTPEAEGGLKADVKLEGKPVEGSPLTLNIEPAPSARLLGPNPARATAKRVFTFPIATKNVQPDDLAIAISDKHGKRLPYRVKDLGDGQLEVKLKPREEGQLKAEVLLEGAPIEGAPLIINVDPEPWAKLVGDSNRHSKVNDPISIEVEYVNMTPKDLKVAVTNGSGQKVKVSKLKPKSNGRFELNFTPTQVSRYTVDIIYRENSESIEGCPCVIDVDPKTNWSDALKDLLSDMDEAQYYDLVPFSDMDHLMVNEPVLFHIVPNTDRKLHATSVGFEGIVTPESGGQVPALITSIDNGKFQLRFVPRTKEKFTVDVQLSKKSINKSPQDVWVGRTVAKPSNDDGGSELKIGLAIDRNVAVVGVPFKFQITFENANWRLVQHTVKDPSGEKVATESNLSSEKFGRGGDKDGMIDVVLTPTVKGPHGVRLYYDTAPTSAEPLIFYVNPTPTAEILGSNPRTDASVNIPFTFQVETVNVRQKQITVGIKGPSGKVVASLNLDPTGKDTIRSKFTEATGRPKNPNGVFDGVFDLTFTGKEVGTYSAMVFLDKKPVVNSPLTIEMGNNPHAGLSHGETTAIDSAEPTPTTVSPRSVASVTTTAVKKTVIQATPVSVQPVKTVKAEPAPVVKSAKVIGSSSREAPVDSPVKIEIAVQNLTASNLSAAIYHESGKTIENTLGDVNSSTAAVTFTPARSGIYRVEIVHNGSQIEGSPVSVSAVREKSKSSSGDKKKSKKKTTSGEPSSSKSKSAEGEKSPRSKQSVTKTTTTRTITRVTVGRSFTIRLQVAGSNGAPAQAPIKDASGKVVANAQCTPAPNDTYEISWVPTAAGKYTTQLVVNGSPVGGSEFEFEAFNMPITCKPISNSDPLAPGIPCTITFAIENAQPKKLSAVIRGSDGKLGTAVSTKKLSNGHWEVNFTPPDSDSFSVELTADSTPVENKVTIQLT